MTLEDMPEPDYSASVAAGEAACAAGESALDIMRREVALDI
jgi:hypothetical protein